MQVDLDLTDAEYESFRLVSDDLNLQNVYGESMVPFRLIEARGKIRRVTSYYLMRYDEVLESDDDLDDKIEEPLSHYRLLVELHLRNTEDRQARGLQFWRGDSGGDTLIATAKKDEDGKWVLAPVLSDRH